MKRKIIDFSGKMVHDRKNLPGEECDCGANSDRDGKFFQHLLVKYERFEVEISMNEC